MIDSVLLNKNPCGCLLERSRFNRRSRQLIWLVQIIRQAINTQISPNNIVIIDSFPLSLCQPVRLWTPLRQKMVRAKQHNHWKLMAMRRTIETRFSELCAFFDVEQTLARGLTGLQLRMEQIVLDL